ncbi:venom metalloproteinase antarease-like TserMP_B [Centruroides vittatus]|uniref:venom metalloproteinase antarease-like TserMP_B n=1 Tax=Centruroides vittatus TaxID=120091 RepID=UPI0035108941
MNCLITFAVVFSIIIADTDEKSFGVERLRKLPVIEKRTVEDVADAQDVQVDSTPPCPVIDVLILIDSPNTRVFSEEEIKSNVNHLIRDAQKRYIDELELNMTLRLIGHITYTNETEPDFIKDSVYMGDREFIVAGEVIYKMRDIEDSPLVSRADVIILETGRDVIHSRPPPGEDVYHIAGMAWSSTACNRVVKFAVARYYAQDIYSVDIFIHELGHLINIGDNYYNEGCSVDLLPGKKKYSFCDKERVEKFLESSHSSCLFDNCDNGEK